jgi:hypothetical protein
MVIMRRISCVSASIPLPMKRVRQHIYFVVLVLALIGSPKVFADEKATSLGDAAAAVEANLRTPEGKAYDQRLGNEFMEKHLSTMKQCKESAGKDLESFWILMKLDKDGVVKEVLLRPTTKMGTCARETLLKSAFSPPPKPVYWVSVYMRLSH